MPIAFFQTQLSVRPTSGGQAQIVVPKALQGLDYHFVAVKDGGDEGIVQIEEPKATIEAVEQDPDCKKLTAKQVETARQSYPPPRLKKKFRVRTAPMEAGDSAVVTEQFEVDQHGNRVVDTFQTVRSGFYLIDVPVISE